MHIIITIYIIYEATFLECFNYRIVLRSGTTHFRLHETYEIKINIVTNTFKPKELPV